MRRLIAILLIMAGLSCDAFPAEREPGSTTGPGYDIRGGAALTLQSSKGFFSDRSFTAAESRLGLQGSGETSEFFLRGRWRRPLGEELAGNIPEVYLTEAWSRWRPPSTAYTVTAGRRYIAEAAGELVDGLSLDARLTERFFLGGFLGFRPDPYDFGFRDEALTTGIYSSWTGGENGSLYSRQALVFNSLRGREDRTYLAWEAGRFFSATAFLRQSLIADLDTTGSGVTLTNYSLQSGWEPIRDLRTTWEASVYRNIFYDVGSAGIPTDTSAIYSTSLGLNYVFRRNVLANASVAFTHRNLDHQNAINYNGSVDLLDLLASGANMGVSYSGTNYYNAFFESYAVTLSRQFLDRIQLTFSPRYQRNLLDTFGDRNRSIFRSLSLGGSYLLNDKYDLAGSFEYQWASLYNGSSVGLGFIRDPLAVGTSADATGYNSFVSVTRRF